MRLVRPRYSSRIPFYLLRRKLYRLRLQMSNDSLQGFSLRRKESLKDNEHMAQSFLGRNDCLKDIYCSMPRFARL